MVSELDNVTQRLISNDPNFHTLEVDLPDLHFKNKGAAIYESFLNGLRVNNTVEEVTVRITKDFLPEEETYELEIENFLVFEAILSLPRLNVINILLVGVCVVESNSIEEIIEEKTTPFIQPPPYIERTGSNTTESSNTSESDIGSSGIDSSITSSSSTDLISSDSSSNNSLGISSILKESDEDCHDVEKETKSSVGQRCLTNLITKNFAKALGLNSTIRRLKLYAPGINWDILSTNFFAVNDHLKQLSLRSTELGISGCVKIARGLRQNRGLQYLDLSCNRIGNIGCEELAKALKYNKALKNLDLSINRVHNKGCVALSKILGTRNKSLTTLNLCGNGIENGGAEALAEALVTNYTLRTLKLSINRIGSIGCSAFGEALKQNTALTNLSLGSNYIEDQGCTSLAMALRGNTSLTILDLSVNKIETRGCQALINALKRNTAIHLLDLRSNFVRSRTVNHCRGNYKMILM